MTNLLKLCWNGHKNILFKMLRIVMCLLHLQTSQDVIQKLDPSIYKHAKVPCTLTFNAVV
jgi:hypothetical protein